MTSILKRILGALLFVPIAVILVYFSTPLIFFIAVGAVVVLCLLEFYRMIEGSGATPHRYMGVVLGLGVVFSFYYGQPTLMAFVIAGGTIALFIRTLLEKEDVHTALGTVSYTLVGIFFIGWLLAHLILLHKMEAGRFYILFLFVIIWAGDTTAYYVGKGLGRHKLAPEVSPEKTIEGAAAGLGGSLAGAYIAKWWFLRQISPTDTFVLGVLLGVTGQLGDLSESMVKRSAAVKDSGRLIPGHGGLLDRLDSLLFSAPIFYYYIITVIET